MKKWPLVDVRKYKIYYISRKQLILDDKNEKCRKHLLQKLKNCTVLNYRSLLGFSTLIGIETLGCVTRLLFISPTEKTSWRSGIVGKRLKLFMFTCFFLYLRSL